MQNRSRRTLLITLFGALFVYGATATSLVGASASEVAFLTKHCFHCHNSEVNEGNLDLTLLAANWAALREFQVWVRVHDRIDRGEMPPAHEERPGERERLAVLADLSARLQSADLLRQRTEGRATMRRLSRSEYENTVRDLFELPGLAVKELLPEDGRIGGFDKMADALPISAVQMAKYMEVADVVLDAAIVHTVAPPDVYKDRLRLVGGLSGIGEYTFPLIDRKASSDVIDYLKSVRLPQRLQALESSESLGIISHAHEAFVPNVGQFSALHSGHYRIRASVWSFRWGPGETMPGKRMQSLALLAGNRSLRYLDAPSLEPTLHELTCWLNAGERLQLNPADLWQLFPDPRKWKGPGVAVDWVDVEGPLHESWPPASHRRLFGDLPMVGLPRHTGASDPRIATPPMRHPGARPQIVKNSPLWTVASAFPQHDAERLLADFLPRAFRRPVESSEVAEYVNVVQGRVQAGECFESAMRAAYKASLCSPNFLFLQEQPGPLDQYAVASRLSYFLWSSLPDDDLMKLAGEGKLTGGMLGTQVDRMLADRKSDRFVEHFLDQWLNLREINATSPDAKLYPEFRPSLRDAMVSESRAFWRELIDADLSLLNVIDSDFAMINQRLADHYGIPGVVGSEIRKVTLPEESHRGGFLTQASVLKVTANGTVTSPVMRGAWVVDRILGQPPPPPPPNISGIDPDVRGTTTIREQLAQHRDIEACAACHAKIDPPGFALESFDVIGGWREKYRSTGEIGDLPDPDADVFYGAPPRMAKQYRLALPVDASGELSDGSRFHDIAQFKQLLLREPANLVENCVKRLLVYATGAAIGFADRNTVKQIVDASREEHYGTRTLLHHVVQSPIFLNK